MSIHPINSFLEYSVAEGHRALQFFTDRNEFTRRFAEYLNDDPPHEKILFFHGDGGNGKSLLLKYLEQNCCKRFPPEIWQQLKSMPDDKHFAAYIENAKSEDYTPVPFALLDFGQQPRSDEQPQDRFYGLLMLRRKLTTACSQMGYRLKFPLYDFACTWYLHQKGKSPEEIRRLFPVSEIAGLIAPFIDALNQHPVGSFGKAVLDIIDKDLGKKFSLYLQQRHLTPDQVDDIRRKDPETELMESLPRWFAQDLNVAMKTENAPSRLVLFFDTHESFWAEKQNQSEERFFFWDEWLRRLLTALDFSGGIVTAVAGREKPLWANAPKFPIPENLLDTQLVWHLSDKDAVDYLQDVGISDEALQNALIQYARVAPNQVHPFYLGLCADVVLTAGLQGKILHSEDFANIPETSAKSRILINRLLRYTDKEIQCAVEALSACRSFDRNLYYKLGELLRFHITRETFGILTRFSFVWQDKEGRENQYRIHDLLRRLYHEIRKDTTQEAHAVLEQHYQEQGKTAEAIYHAICRNSHRGEKEWLETFKKAKQQGNMELCSALLKIRQETSLYVDK